VLVVLKACVVLSCVADMLPCWVDELKKKNPKKISTVTIRVTTYVAVANRQ